MLNEIHIKGFQSHNDSYLSFNPGVNVIIGSSDSGKSSIIRAIKWLTTNRPQGDSFRNEFLDAKDVVSVTGDFDGLIIAREKSKNINQYTLIDRPDGIHPTVDIHFKALRADVPPELQQITKFKEVNIQSQHPDEQYFMLNLSAGQVAKKFNEVAGLEIMDRAMSKINSMVREVNSDLKHAEKELSDRKDKLDSLEWSVEALKEVEELAVREKKIQTAIVTFQVMEDVVFDLRGLDRELIQFNGIDNVLEELNQIIVKSHELRNAVNNHNSLKTTLRMLSDCDISLRVYDGIDIAFNVITDIEKRFNKIQEKQFAFTALDTLLDEIAFDSKRIEQETEELVYMETEFTELIKVCPLCGRS